MAERIRSKFLFRSDWTPAASRAARVKLHSSCGARIRATTDNISHETHEKTRNIIFIFVPFRGFRGQQYFIKEIKFLSRLGRPFFWPAAGLTPENRHVKPI